jgi:diguanylate cyclase (GGDEF)-like protein
VKILIVEDDLISRRLLQKTLEDWGHEVIPTEDGQEAWEIFKKTRPKFIIADWLMPKMDGVDLCRNIREFESEGYVYFIFLTGKDKKEEIIEGLSQGADDYLTKPFDRNELQVRIRTGERILNQERELNEKNKELQELNTKLEELAMIDPLTGIGNRRNFYESVMKTHHRACRYLQGYGVIICDIDDFKAYNDTYGHLEGDEILKKIADRTQSVLRASDEVFRYGGEEFVILLQGQEFEGVKVFAEKVRVAIESLQIRHDGSTRGFVTISCGADAFNEGDKDNKWDVILNRADQALYKAKALGKNRVETLMKSS